MLISLSSLIVIRLHIRQCRSENICILECSKKDEGKFISIFFMCLLVFVVCLLCCFCFYSCVLVYKAELPIRVISFPDDPTPIQHAHGGSNTTQKLAQPTLANCPTLVDGQPLAWCVPPLKVQSENC